MGWETRRGKRVYYRKEWTGKRVVSIYCGSGERGEAAAREDEERRRQRRERRLQRPQHRKETPVTVVAPATRPPCSPKLEEYLAKLPRWRRREVEWRMRRHEEQTRARRAGEVLKIQR